MTTQPDQDHRGAPDAGRPTVGTATSTVPAPDVDPSRRTEAGPALPAPPGSFAGPRAAAWQALLLYHATVVAELSARMERAGELSWGRYDVLVHLDRAPHGLRLKELGERLVISQPGLSRRIDRMACDGLVTRRADPRDGRGVVVSPTRSGRAALRRAAAHYVPAVQEAFTDHVSEAEAQALLTLLTRLRGLPRP